MVGLINFSRTGKFSKELEEIFIARAYDKIKKKLGTQKSLDDFLKKEIDKMSKCKTITKHLNSRQDNSNGNRKVKYLVDKNTKKEEKADDEESKIVNAKDAWITVTDKAIYINISLKDVKDIPVSEWENEETGEKKERITLVGSRALLEKVINGEKKGVPLAYFKEA